MSNGENRKKVLIILHIIFGIVFVGMAAALIFSGIEVQRLADLASAPPSMVLPTPTPTPPATPTPTSSPILMPTPTATPTPLPTLTPIVTESDVPVGPVVPTKTPTKPKTPKPTPEFTYTVSNEDGVAPAGYTLVFVKVNPPGNYKVTYDGKAMNKKDDEYWLQVKKLDGGNYRSHVKVTK